MRVRTTPGTVVSEAKVHGLVGDMRHWRSAFRWRGYIAHVLVTPSANRSPPSLARQGDDRLGFRVDLE